MRISVLLVAVIPIFALIQASAAETESATTTMSAPGKVEMAQVVEGSAVITAIDKAKRTFDVKRQNGDEVTIDAGPGLKSFDQLKVGDTVSVSYTESLALELKKGGGMKVEKTEVAAMIPAKPGEAPAGAAGRQVTVVGDVIEVDTSTQTHHGQGPSADGPPEGARPGAVQARRRRRSNRGDVYRSRRAIRDASRQARGCR